ncbi:2-dehydropantoate 2-reductase [Bacillus sp. EB600]|uniref:2-dehydropantoate 2-reductase n=1 Tax=Bacillus sp. EB600 TaxID=2806345 RepID=UPI0021092985|nr:2-dehydropantoate 2-reductase [Bacillus sp. EB600]MCQ6279764.1 2-dehydropantoate 2-reductase [Bacillus sp. EB600]
MRIGIIGAGSIGLLFAAYLSETCPVTVYTKTVDQAKDINKNGIVLVKNRQEIKRDVEARGIDTWNGQEDLIIVAVKQYQLEEIIKKISQITKIPLNILFLQNGMGHLKLLSRLEGHNLFVGSVEHGAYKESAYRVRQNGEGVTNLALFCGALAGLSSFISLVPIDFPVCFHENYYEMLLNKLIINAVINPLTAILQVENGGLLKNDYYYNVLKDLFTEITFILNLEEPDIYFNRVIEVCQNTAQNRSSMLKDIVSGRKTEVDAILGFLLEKAQQEAKPAPLINSFYNLVKGKEMNGQAGESSMNNNIAPSS